MKHKVYGKWMGIGWREEKPVQPKREDRNFLSYVSKPEVVPVENYIDPNGNFSFSLKSMPLIEICSRTTIENINFGALQVWLDHLGKAIYNPINVTLLPNGEHILAVDGDHRTRCLWEIGEPEVTVMLRKSSKLQCEGMEYTKWFPWVKQVKKLNSYEPTLKRVKGFNYYPDLTQPPPILQKYYDFKTHDGPYYKDSLDTTKTVREILFRAGQARLYREKVLDNILNCVDVKDKRILDVGCHFGYYTFLLLEAGAKTSTCVDISEFKIKVVKIIAARRQLQVNAYQKTIGRFLVEHHDYYDVVLLLNVFHHLLKKDSVEAWNMLNKLLDNSEVLFLMMGVTDPDWHVLDEFDNNVEAAVSEMTGCKIKPLFKTGYRGRTLYVLS